MKQILDNLWVGSDLDVGPFKAKYSDGYIVHAAKDPWHRKAIGYTGRGAPKDSPEYLVAQRGRELCLNLVDSDDPRWIPQAPFDAAVQFFFIHYVDNHSPLLIHCNQGFSRGPGVAMWCLKAYNRLSTDFGLAYAQFKQMYPDFLPGAGVKGFLEANW